MRMAQLSSVAGIPIGTIKFYQREGLLPPGERTSPNQADYDERHVRRLRLIRGLIDVGRLSIVEARTRSIPTSAWPRRSSWRSTPSPSTSTPPSWIRARWTWWMLPCRGGASVRTTPAVSPPRG
jgi:hypothetical protein